MSKKSRFQKRNNSKTRGPRWPWIAHLNFWDNHSLFFFFFWGIETKFIILLSNFQKVTCKVHFEIWPSVSKGRIFKNSSFLYKSKYPPSTRAMFLDGSKFTNKFSKGSPKEHFGIFFFKSDQGFQRKRIFKNFIMSI